eukprot:92943-Pyramimonas_sp.AAC.1
MSAMWDPNVNGVYHVKAHGSKARAELLEASERRIAKGSAEVDLLAQAGAELDAYCGKHQAIEDQARRVRRLVTSADGRGMA